MNGMNETSETNETNRLSDISGRSGRSGIKRYGLLLLGVLALGGALLVATIASIALPAAAQPQRTGTTVSGTPVSGGSSGSGITMMNGSGMMGNMGSGMMGGDSPQGTQAGSNAQRLSGDQVRKAVVAYLDSNYNGQGLAIEEIMEFQNNFYAQVKESSTSVNAFELLIDPYTGKVWPEYGPNMMWNTKYGPMAQGMGGTGSMMNGGMMGGTSGMMGGSDGTSGMMGGSDGMMGGTSGTSGMMGNMMSGVGRINEPTANMPVNAQQAVQYAQQYLDAQGTGLTAESQPDTFYGYYTIHTLKNGQIEGMLSVNGYTGQVWYHTWHGTFITMVGN